MLSKIKQKLIKWCLNEQIIEIGDLHKSLNPHPCKIYDDDTHKLKFIEQTDPMNVLVKTPTGWSSIKHSSKTKPYETWELKLTNHQLKCADTHIIIDENGNEIFVNTLNPGQLVETSTGLEQVKSITNTKNIQTMYDLELNDDNHVYYTNGILSHNSITSAAYLLWFAIFNFDKTILIASNKNSNAMEMIHRIRFAYEYLPMWLKPGVEDDGWNKHNVGFDNKSRIVSTATSEDSGRGLSISLLFLDEFAFVKPAVQDDFWTAMSPTLSTGGACICTSTPNGDTNIFAQLWRGAQVGANGFHPIRVYWDQPPGRNEDWKEDEIGRVGQRKWLQEYECCSIDTKISVQYQNGDIRFLTFGELYSEME